jgi:hypothetical protein
MLQERLRYQRVQLDVPVKCQWSIDFYHQVAAGQGVNLSASGMLVTLDVTPPSNLTLWVTFQPEDEQEPFVLPAQLVRAAPAQAYGLRFVAVPSDIRHRLMNYVRGRLERESVESEAAVVSGATL